MNHLEEEWRSMKSIGYTNYQCSDFGRIKNGKNNKILPGALIASGYIINRLKNNSNKQRNIRTHIAISKIFWRE